MEYWPQDVAVRREQTWLEKSSFMETELGMHLPAFENKIKCTTYSPLHGHGLYGKIPTKKDPIRTVRFT